MYKNKPTEEELPNSYDELVPVSDLERDKFNVRDVNPDEELVSSIEKTGFKFPVTVRPNPEKGSKFLITDGWQRYQSALKAGYTHIPCDIYSKLEAFREAERSSIQNPWTNYQRVKHNSCWFNELMEEGYSKREAMNFIVENGSIAKKTLRKYIRIFNLPKDVHVLLKKPKNRPSGWEDRFLFRAENLNDSDGLLKIEVARDIGKAYSEGKISREQSKLFCVQAVKNSDKNVISKAVEKVSKFPETSVRDAVNEELQRQKNRGNEGVSVGSIILQEDEKQYFDAYRRQSRMTTKKIVKEAVSEKMQKIKEENVLKEEYKP